MYYLDLFSGLGGFALGAYWAGWRFDEYYFSEVDEYAIKVYRQRFPDAEALGDITAIDTGDLPKGDWVITGGFPCQDISNAGKRKGIQGSRSGLWFEMWRIIRDLRPRWVIAENVGAITFRGLAVVLNSLAQIGYDAEWTDIRASDMGAPHRRERIWIVAYPYSKNIQRRFKQSRSYREQIRTMALPKTWQTNESILSPSALCRTSDGIPHRVERTKCLGNSIVPQIAELLFNQIKEVECFRMHKEK